MECLSQNLKIPSEKCAECTNCRNICKNWEMVDSTQGLGLQTKCLKEFCNKKILKVILQSTDLSRIEKENYITHELSNNLPVRTNLEKRSIVSGGMTNRRKNCGKCEGCLRPNCRVCCFCIDKSSGRGLLKQRCKLRNCVNKPLKRISKDKLLNTDAMMPHPVLTDVREDNNDKIKPEYSFKVEEKYQEFIEEEFITVKCGICIGCVIGCDSCNECSVCKQIKKDRKEGDCLMRACIQIEENDQIIGWHFMRKYGISIDDIQNKTLPKLKVIPNGLIRELHLLWRRHFCTNWMDFLNCIRSVSAFDLSYFSNNTLHVKVIDMLRKHKETFRRVKEVRRNTQIQSVYSFDDSQFLPDSSFKKDQPVVGRKGEAGFWKIINSPSSDPTHQYRCRKESYANFDIKIENEDETEEERKREDEMRDDNHSALNRGSQDLIEAVQKRIKEGIRARCGIDTLPGISLESKSISVSNRIYTLQARKILRNMKLKHAVLQSKLYSMNKRRKMLANVAEETYDELLKAYEEDQSKINTIDMLENHIEILKFDVELMRMQLQKLEADNSQALDQPKEIAELFEMVKAYGERMKKIQKASETEFTHTLDSVIERLFKLDLPFERVTKVMKDIMDWHQETEIFKKSSTQSQDLVINYNIELQRKCKMTAANLDLKCAKKMKQGSTFSRRNTETCSSDKNEMLKSRLDGPTEGRCLEMESLQQMTEFKDCKTAHRDSKQGNHERFSLTQNPNKSEDMKHDFGYNEPQFEGMTKLEMKKKRGGQVSGGHKKKNEHSSGGDEIKGKVEIDDRKRERNEQMSKQKRKLHEEDENNRDGKRHMDSKRNEGHRRVESKERTLSPTERNRNGMENEGRKMAESEHKGSMLPKIRPTVKSCNLPNKPVLPSIEEDIYLDVDGTIIIKDIGKLFDI